jgi:hypothetical protein
MPRPGTRPESNESAELALPRACPQRTSGRCGEMRRFSSMSRGPSDMRPRTLRCRTSSVDARAAGIHPPRDFGRAVADVKGWRRGTRQPSTRLPNGPATVVVVAQTVPNHRFAIELSRSPCRAMCAASSDEQLAQSMGRRYSAPLDGSEERGRWACAARGGPEASTGHDPKRERRPG